MLTKFLDMAAAVFLISAGYLSYVTPVEAFDLTATFALAVGLFIFALSSMIKDNYFDLLHCLSAGIFAYYVNPILAVAYLSVIILVRRNKTAQVIIATVCYTGFLTTLLQ